jgi:hypothetical protein
MSKLNFLTSIPVKKLNLQSLKFFRLVVHLAASVHHYELSVELQLAGENKCTQSRKAGSEPHFTTQIQHEQP